MKLLTHKQIPVAKLRPLQDAVDKVVASRVVFEKAVAELSAARKQIPDDKQKPTDSKKVAAWEAKCEARRRQAGICDEAVQAGLETLAADNTELRNTVEKFRGFAAELYAEDHCEGARRAAMNVLSTDQLCAEVEDQIIAERAGRKTPLWDSLLLRQQFLANQRHFTVRIRVDSARWTYLQNRGGDFKLGQHPSVPCLTFAEAQERCMQMGRNLDAKTAQMGYEVQCYDVVKEQRCGVSVCRSMGIMPRAED